MTAIKRSFYYVLAIILAIVLMFPLFRTGDVSKARAASVASSGEIAASIMISTGNISSLQHKASFDNIYAIQNSGSFAAAAAPAALESEAPLGDVALSTTFNIAATASDPITITDSEKTMIAAAVQLEVVGRYSNIYQFENADLKYYEMLAVAQIIKNRLNNEMFPATVHDVIHFTSYNDAGEKVYQFSTSPAVPYTTPSKEALMAVSEVFDDGVNVIPEDYVYFCASWRESAFEINNRAVLKYVGSAEDFDKIIADATTFYAGVTIQDNMAHSFIY